MPDFDVFNGDADGLCALQQLRLAEPRESQLITGVKRDIALLARVQARAGDRVDVLDLSLDKNREALLDLLELGVQVRYFDHHHAGTLPQHPNLQLYLEGHSRRGTSLLVDAFLNGRYRAWAVVGTFGDNFDETAEQAAQPLGLDEQQLAELRALGIYLNYNSYGEQVSDLHIPPDVLFRQLQPYENPLDFIAEEDSFALLRAGFHEDLRCAEAMQPAWEDERHRLYVLPDAPWARRVSGVFANRLARQAPASAHAVLTPSSTGDYVVSVRAPLSEPQGADLLCRQFPTGGGRQAAAGINRLPKSAYEEFLQAFQAAF